MLKRIDSDQNNMIAYEVVGELSAKDYQDVLHPVLEEARAKGEKINFLYYFGPEFTKVSLGAMLSHLQFVKTSSKNTKSSSLCG